MKSALTAIAAAAVLVVPTLSNATAPTGDTSTQGYYAGTSLISNVTGSCPFVSGQHIKSVFFFPGYNKNGAVERAPFQGPEGYPEIVQLVFTSKTPKKNVDTWSGSASISSGPDDAVAYQGTGTFSTDELIYGTGFIVQTINYSFNSGSCTFTAQQTFIKTGAATSSPIGSIPTQCGPAATSSPAGKPC